MVSRLQYTLLFFVLDIEPWDLQKIYIMRNRVLRKVSLSNFDVDLTNKLCIGEHKYDESLYFLFRICYLGVKIIKGHKQFKMFPGRKYIDWDKTKSLFIDGVKE